VLLDGTKSYFLNQEAQESYTLAISFHTFPQMSRRLRDPDMAGRDFRFASTNSIPVYQQVEMLNGSTIA